MIVCSVTVEIDGGRNRKFRPGIEKRIRYEKRNRSLVKGMVLRQTDMYNTRLIDKQGHDPSGQIVTDFAAVADGIIWEICYFLPRFHIEPPFFLQT